VIEASDPEPCVASDLPSTTKLKNDPDSAVCFDSLLEPNDAYSRLRLKLRIASRTDGSDSSARHFADGDTFESSLMHRAETRVRRAVISDGAGGILIVLLGLVLRLISTTSDDALVLTSAWANLIVGAAIGVACLFSKSQRPMGAITLLVAVIGNVVLENSAKP
jgi:hypothetical protein